MWAKEAGLKKTALACSLALAVATEALTADPGGQSAETVLRYVAGVLDGRFTYAGPWGPGSPTVDMTGTLRNLGLAKMHTTHTASPDGVISGGQFVIVAANGDTIRGRYTASGDWVSDVQILGTATLLIEEGTGRFHLARGRLPPPSSRHSTTRPGLPPRSAGPSKARSNTDELTNQGPPGRRGSISSRTVGQRRATCVVAGVAK